MVSFDIIVRYARINHNECLIYHFKYLQVFLIFISYLSVFIIFKRAIMCVPPNTIHIQCLGLYQYIVGEFNC